MARRLRLRWHRGTTAQICSVYPFSVHAPLSAAGPLIGVDTLAGGGEFCWDPFEAYAEGLVTNPNAWVFGEPGNAKSALVKCLLWRTAALYGLGAAGRWVAVADPKGEYTTLAARLGLTVVRLAPGGSARLNPLAAGPTPGSPHERVLRSAEMVAALIATVMDQPLAAEEDATVYAAVDDTLRAGGAEPTLTDVGARLHTPTDAMAAAVRRTPAEVTEAARPLGYALDKLLARDLRGMFDGPSTIPLRWDGPGLVLDLSAVAAGSAGLAVVMVAAAGWLRELMAGPGPPRLQVIDEAWTLLANRQTAAYLQACWKLGRSYGVANIGIAHRPTDLGAQADDGTAVAKIAQGLLADTATKIIYRQAPDQLPGARRLFGLTDAQTDCVGQLVRGRALWLVGGRAAVVHHLLAPAEAALCDTDARMAPAAA